MNSSAPQICPAPRTSLACENCRSRKARCLSSRKDGICQRCLASRLNCVFATRKVPERDTNKKKSQRLPDDGQNHVPQPAPGVAESREEDVISGLFKPALPASSIDNSIFAIQDMHRRFLQVLFPTSQPNKYEQNKAPQRKPSIPETYQDTNEKPSGRVSVTRPQAEEFIQKYEYLIRSFPFVVLPKGWTLAKMLGDHPFMSLGIFCAMASSQPRLQRQMDEEFRRVFSEKVIVQQEQSLDILQGLLIYSAKYPLHHNPRSKQLLQMLQIAISMAEDLKLDTQQPRVDTGQGIAAKRAYLGIFYLSSVAGAHKKRNKMEHTPYMDFVAAELSQNLEYETDALLAILFRLQACNEDIGKLTLGCPAYQSFAGSLLDASLQSYQNQIQNVSEMLLPDASKNATILLAQKFANLNLYAQLISVPSQPPATILAPQPPPSNLFTLCTQATKDFYEALTSMDASEYHNLTMVEWLHLVEATITMFRLLSISPMLVGAASNVVGELMQFGRYLEVLCFRMGALSATQKGSNDPPDFFCLWESVLGIVHERFSRLAKEVGQSQIRVTAALCPIMSGAIKSSDYWDAWEQDKLDLNGGFTTSVVPDLGNMGTNLTTPPVTQSWEAWTQGLFDAGHGIEEPSPVFQ